MRLSTGKIPINLLREVVFRSLGDKREEIVVGPAVGFDGAVINVGDKAVVVAMDPVTGAVERVGWLAVNVNANDVATFGVEPAFFFSSILLPEKLNTRTLKSICNQMDEAAKTLRIGIAGGHCEVTQGIADPIVVGCAMGITGQGDYVTAGGAKPADKLIMTKSAGIEGTAILASDREKLLKSVIEASALDKAKSLFERVSVVKEALTAIESGGVGAMHDPTEGGVSGGVHEMADASKVGVRISHNEIPVTAETLDICDFFEIDPLQLISSGALLISVKPESADRVVRNVVKQGIHATIIGEFTERRDERILIEKDGSQRALPRPVSDHLWLALRDKSPEFL